MAIPYHSRVSSGSIVQLLIMPPNIADSAEGSDNSQEENKIMNTREETIEMQQPPSTPTPFLNGASRPKEPESLTVTMVLSTMNLVVHIFIGAIVGTVYMFTFSNGVPLGATPLHITLCVTGYQLLMAEAIMTLSHQNGWISKLNLRQKRKVHLTLQLVGSALAIAGTSIKIADKTEHWTTTHGIFGLIALVFTSVSLINGCASLYAQELSKILPGNVSKILHVCFGTIAFTAANITLCFGFDKMLFRLWATDPLANLYISLTAMMLFLVILAPLATFKKKLSGFLKR